MNNRHRKLRMEQMEAREMMAGDVTASVVNGNLILNEAAGHIGENNQVLISQISTQVGKDRIRVTGLPIGSGKGSLINGKTSQDFVVTGDLTVNFGGGDDLVNFDASAAPNFRDVTLNMGAPPLGVTADPTARTASSDKDSVMLWDEHIRGSLTVNTGIDDDWVFVANGSIGNNITVNTGAGVDEVDVKFLTGQLAGAIDIQTFVSGEKDLDAVVLDQVTALGNISIRTGDGGDDIELHQVTSFKKLSLDAGAGDDTVKLDYVIAVDNFMASLGDGNDVITVNDLYLPTGMGTIDGGAGSDKLTMSGAFPTGVVKTHVEWINGVPAPGLQVILPTTPTSLL
jgi:hypothetical protein